MSKDKGDEVKQLKKDYFDLLEERRDEREALLSVIHTFSLLASIPDDMAEDVRAIKGLIHPEGNLPIEEITQGIKRMKDRIIAKEKDTESYEGDRSQIKAMENKLIEACRIIKRFMSAILDGFYPLTEEMSAEANDIKIECKGVPEQMKIKEPSENLIHFIQKIKIKISEDFKDINRVFFILLEQVKEIERSITSEFGGDKPQKEVEYFEMKINREMGSIAESFNIHTTINEIKKVVFTKLKNIKSLVSQRKKEETKRNISALESIKKLKKRINEVESKAQKMSKRAARFQEAAMRDALTGLFSRGAFDMRVKEALIALNEKGAGFSLILFDVDKFKSINDTLGHVAGDKVLKKVAECLEETFRKDDFIARYGGDEFVVIIEGFTKKMALERIPLFKENLKKRRFVSYKEGEIRLNVSAGTTQAEEGDTLERIIERADRAMYELKQGNG